MLKTSFIPANCNTVVYNGNQKGDLNFTTNGTGVTRKKNPILKDLAFEMNFFNTIVEFDRNGNKPTIVYIGYGDASHLVKIFDFYEFCDFFVFDEKEYSNELKSYESTHENVSLFEYLPEEDDLESMRDMPNLYLISNYVSMEVRDLKESSNYDVRYEQHMLKEKHNVKDSRTNMMYAEKINAVASLINFRPPHIHSEEELKKFDLEELIPGDFHFFEGIILLPIFSGNKSSGCKIIVKNYQKQIKYNYVNLTHGINKWNIHTKEKPALNPFNDTKTPLPYQLGNHFEISILFSIFRDYFTSIGIESVSAEDVYNMYTSIISTEESNFEHCK